MAVVGSSLRDPLASNFIVLSFGHDKSATKQFFLVNKGIFGGRQTKSGRNTLIQLEAKPLLITRTHLIIIPTNTIDQNGFKVEESEK